MACGSGGVSQAVSTALSPLHLCPSAAHLPFRPPGLPASPVLTQLVLGLVLPPLIRVPHWPAPGSPFRWTWLTFGARLLECKASNEQNKSRVSEISRQLLVFTVPCMLDFLFLFSTLRKRCFLDLAQKRTVPYLLYANERILCII